MEPNGYTHMHTIHGVHVCAVGVHDYYIPHFRQLQHVQGMGSTKWYQERETQRLKVPVLLFMCSWDQK